MCQDLVEEETLDLSSVFRSQSSQSLRYFSKPIFLVDFLPDCRGQRAKCHDPGSTWCWTRPSYSFFATDLPSEANTSASSRFQDRFQGRYCACSHLLVLLSMFRVSCMKIKDRPRFSFVLKCSKTFTTCVDTK